MQNKRKLIIYEVIYDIAFHFLDAFCFKVLPLLSWFHKNYSTYFSCNVIPLRYQQYVSYIIWAVVLPYFPYFASFTIITNISKLLFNKCSKKYYTSEELIKPYQNHRKIQVQCDTSIYIYKFANKM